MAGTDYLISALSPAELRLYDSLLERITEGGRRFLFWGATPSLLRVLTALRATDLEWTIAALVDSSDRHSDLLLLGHKVQPPTAVPNLTFDTLIVTDDARKEAILKQFAAADERRPRVLLLGHDHYAFHDPMYDQLQASGLVKSRAGGYELMQVHLYQALRYIVRRGLIGDVAEFGVYKGGTTTFIARTLSALNHPATVWAFDTFAGFPPARSVLDMYDAAADEFSDYDSVRRLTGGYPNIALVVGDIVETAAQLEGRPLVLSFFDTDNYTATRTALAVAYEQTVPGGVLAFDHYYSPDWPGTIGERMAAAELLADANVFNLQGTGIFLKWA